jgi:uroporphyrinogen decarboxylase
MNKRDSVLSVISNTAAHAYVPAAFFLHFDPAYHQGQAAVDKHLEFFRHTGMDFVKVQYEQTLPQPPAAIRTAEDWARVPRYPEEFSEGPVRVVEGLVKAAKHEALVIMTVYSPFMWAVRMADEGVLAAHLKEDPEAVRTGLEIMTENVLSLVRGCKRVGVDGFYVSTQGGEAHRFGNTDIFKQYIKPTDLAVWHEVQNSSFNILHVCDYHDSYDDYTPFLDYPGHVVNCSLKVGERTLTPQDAATMFGRPFMGGMERKGVIAAGSAPEIRKAAESVLAHAPEQFMLGADCTVPSEIPWDNLKVAIDTAHRYRK